MTTTPTDEAPESLEVCLTLARADAEVRRRFDASLSSLYGLSLNDFTVLRTLRAAPGGRLRRVDLAARLGLTPSGVTRLLVPLEKIGHVDRHANPDDARVALASLTAAGEALVVDAEGTAGRLADDVFDHRLSAEELAVLGRLLARLAPPDL
ncbi:MAG: MarR family transcriptional regulator [Acidimicrobiales bacterium]|nr:MarR family transcriptional regulator [Acidimicrobiales bacterium]